MAKLTMAQIAGVAVDAGFPDGKATVPVMVAIAMAESGGQTDAKNPSSTASGLWQEMQGNWNGGDPMNPLENARMARATYRSQGLTAWVTWTSGAYLAFMPMAIAASKSPDHSYPGGKGGTTGDASGGATAPTSANNPASSAVSKITMGSMWVRVGAFVLGLVLLAFGLTRLMGTNRSATQIGTTVVKRVVEHAK